MKKLLIAVLALCAVCSVYAQDTQKSAVASWDFISFTFVPGVPPPESVLDVYGVKVGVPVGFGTRNAFVAGTEISFLASLTPYVYGVQGAVLFNDSTRVEGLQASFIYNIAKDVKGVQFSIVNYAEDSAFQVGIINIIKNSPLYICPFINVRF